MRIVIVTPAAPHPFGDTAAKWFYVLIQELLRRGHQISCITASEEAESRVADSKARLSQFASPGQFQFRFLPMASSVPRFFRKLRTAYRPFSELLYSDGFEKALVSELEKGYDVLHLEQLWTGWAGFERPRSLLNVHHFELIDLELQKTSTWHDKKMLSHMRRATETILRSSQNIRVFTSRLLEKARTMNTAAKYWVVPFALDLGLYPFQPLTEEPVVGLMGSMHWLPSRSAGERLLTKIWPLVKQQIPESRLLIAGWNAKKFLGHHLPSPDVTLEENLAHPRDFFSRVAVMVYPPVRGSGMKIKILEAMAYGVPTVTTWEGVEGIHYENGVHCWVENEDERIAEKICRLLRAREERQLMRVAARQLMEQSYSPRPVVEHMVEIYHAVAAS